jgi:hypothetical protein
MGAHEREKSVTGMRRLTQEEVDSFSYTMGELRYLAREHGVLLPRGALHHEIVRALAAAGVRLPLKQAAQPLLAGLPAVTGPDVTAGLLSRIVRGYPSMSLRWLRILPLTVRARSWRTTRTANEAAVPAGLLSERRPALLSQ